MPNDDHQRMLEALAIEEAKGKWVCVTCGTIFPSRTMAKIMLMGWGIALAGLALTILVLGGNFWVSLTFLVGSVICFFHRFGCPACKSRSVIPADTKHGREIVATTASKPPTVSVS